eukprot:scaffold18129_cov126-Skeletonema_menzelii.AAC.1
MATPSTTPRRLTRFISDPVESPFPYNASPLTTVASPQHDDNKNKNDLPFSSTQIREITAIFELFNPTLSGYLDIETFEVMMLSLGYRVTRQDIIEIMQDIIISCSSDDQESTDAINNNSIDLSMAMKILARKGYATNKRNSEDEARIYFRLFDVNNKGYITVEDLKRVQQEAIQLEQEMLTSSHSISSSTEPVTDDFVQAIIEQYDVNDKGYITVEDLKRVLEQQILPSSDSSRAATLEQTQSRDFHSRAR